jgi:hypothetical protein
VSCDQDDVRQIALGLPGVREARERFAFSVEHKGKDKGLVWAWRKRVDAKKPKVPQPDVLVVPVADQVEKAALLAADPDKFFTEDHYNGYAAVLLRLDAVSRGELAQVLLEAWRCVAPKALIEAYEAGGTPTAKAKPRKPAAKKPAAKKPAAKKPAAKPKPKKPRKAPAR